MSQSNQQFTVMLADVTGSTQLYEKLGDNSQATKIIGSTLKLMSGIVEKYNGIIIKTIGDKIMVRFDHPDAAVQAACMIQEMLEQAPVENDVQIKVRIGLHKGPALLQSDGDLYGYAVNIAARMAGIAKARQIINSEDTLDSLNGDLQDKCRALDRTAVKGKSKEMLIHEVIWEPDDATRMTSLDTFPPHMEEPCSRASLPGY